MNPQGKVWVVSVARKSNWQQLTLKISGTVVADDLPEIVAEAKKAVVHGVGLLLSGGAPWAVWCAVVAAVSPLVPVVGCYQPADNGYWVAASKSGLRVGSFVSTLCWEEDLPAINWRKQTSANPVVSEGQPLPPLGKTN